MLIELTFESTMDKRKRVTDEKYTDEEWMHIVLRLNKKKMIIKFRQIEIGAAKNENCTFGE